MNGAVTSPYVYEQADDAGLLCHFEVYYDVTNPVLPLVDDAGAGGAIRAKRQQGCAYNYILIYRPGAATPDSFPLPNAGRKDANGYYTSVISAATAAQAGYANFTNAASWTVSATTV